MQVKTKSILKTIVPVSLALGFLQFLFTAIPNGTKLDGNWRPVSDDSEAGLNTLIRDGWELVSTHVGQNAWYSLGCGHSMSQMNFVLRRPAA